MSRRDDDFKNRRWKHDGGGRRSLPPVQRAPSPVEGFGAGAHGNARYAKKLEKYNPSQMYEAAAKSSAAKLNESKEKKHKTKFVNLYGEKGQERAVMKLPGRNECNCQASSHPLVNNCLKCGRIVCEQEGSGRCFFCYALVCSRDEQRVLDQGGRKADELRKRLLLALPPKPIGKKQEEQSGEENLVEDEAVITTRSGKGATPSSSASSGRSSGKNYEQGLEKAVAEKNRLLEYQRSGARRTMVYDDESDYFNAGNTWLTPDEREKLRKREEELRAMKNLPRSQQKITLDFARREVIAEQQSVDLSDVNDAVIQEIYFGGGGSQIDQDLLLSGSDDIHRPGFFRPMYDNGTEPANNTTVQSHTALKENSRLQDSTLQDIRDQGRCLSMYQPYASLLVHGIKKHEGRSWYTSHRGLLWIASTAKPPAKETVQDVENFYRLFYNECLPSEFPSHYPSGCLLGCVDVVDCLPQEQYRELYPGGESDSPYVFICENPRELTTFFPIRGQHKIYNIDPIIHQAAKKMIAQRALAK